MEATHEALTLEQLAARIVTEGVEELERRAAQRSTAARLRAERNGTRLVRALGSIAGQPVALEEAPELRLDIGGVSVALEAVGERTVQVRRLCECGAVSRHHWIAGTLAGIYEAAARPDADTRCGACYQRDVTRAEDAADRLAAAVRRFYLDDLADVP